jgi:hypothetical protein
MKMRRGMLDRLEKLDGSKRSRAIVLATLPDEEEVEARAFAPTCEEWERRHCWSEEAERSKR